MGQGIWRNRQAQVFGGEAGVKVVNVERLATILRQFIGNGEILIVGQDKARLGIHQHVVSSLAGIGWVKRQRSYTDIGAIRVREGDQIGWALGGSTRATVCFFTNFLPNSAELRGLATASILGTDSVRRTHLGNQDAGFSSCGGETALARSAFAR